MLSQPTPLLQIQQLNRELFVDGAGSLVVVQDERAEIHARKHQQAPIEHKAVIAGGIGGIDQRLHVLAEFRRQEHLRLHSARAVHLRRNIKRNGRRRVERVREILVQRIAVEFRRLGERRLVTVRVVPHVPKALSHGIVIVVVCDENNVLTEVRLDVHNRAVIRRIAAIR